MTVSAPRGFRTRRAAGPPTESCCDHNSVLLVGTSGLGEWKTPCPRSPGPGGEATPSTRRSRGRPELGTCPGAVTVGLLPEKTPGGRPGAGGSPQWVTAGAPATSTWGNSFGPWAALPGQAPSHVSTLPCPSGHLTALLPRQPGRKCRFPGAGGWSGASRRPGSCGRAPTMLCASVSSSAAQGLYCWPLTGLEGVAFHSTLRKAEYSSHGPREAGRARQQDPESGEHSRK